MSDTETLRERIEALRKFSSPNGFSLADVYNAALDDVLMQIDNMASGMVRYDPHCHTFQTDGAPQGGPSYSTEYVQSLLSDEAEGSPQPAEPRPMRTVKVPEVDPLAREIDKLAKHRA